MSKFVLAALLALLASCGFLKQPVGPTVKVSERTVKVVRTCTNPELNGGGSGVDVGGGYVVTAAHMIADPEEGCAYAVSDQRGYESPAVALSKHPVADAATLRVERELEPICFRQAAPDEPVVAVGYPHGKHTVSRGRIVTEPDAEFAQWAYLPGTDPGSSGGGAWTEEGCLAGLTVAKIPGTPFTVVVTSRALIPLLP